MWKKAVRIGFLILLSLYGVYLTVLYIFQGQLIYPGTRLHAVAQLDAPDSAQLYQLPIAEGKIEALLLPASETHDTSKPLLIFAHGNHELIDYWLTRLNGFRQRGFHLLLVEYPGYGRSQGVPSETSITQAMVAAYDVMASDPRIDHQRIYGYGMSLGGGAIAALAKQRPLRALILQSTFPSLRLFAARYLAPQWLLKDPFDSQAVLQNYTGPVMVIHGEQDGLIPWAQAQALADVSTNSKFHLYQCGHVCWDPERLPFWHDFDVFIQRPEKQQR